MDTFVNKLNELLAEYSTMKFLIAEILLCLIAASVLGLIIGWLCKAAFAREKLMERESDWERKLLEKEADHERSQEIAKKDQQTLNQKINELQDNNKSLNQSLEANKSAVHKARIEIQQLNKKQSDTQSKLQTLITEKDREISQLKQENLKGKDTPPRPFGLRSAGNDSNQAPRQNNGARSVKPKPNSFTQNRSRVGGVPANESQSRSTEKSFKPGTQVGSDELDKTQVIESSNPNNAKAPAYRDALREANPVRTNDNKSSDSAKVTRTRSVGSAEPNRRGDDFTQGKSKEDSKIREVSSYQQRDNHRGRSDAGHDNVTDLTQASQGDATADNTQSVEQKESRSLWKRLKSTFSTTVDKTKL